MNTKSNVEKAHTHRRTNIALSVILILFLSLGIAHPEQAVLGWSGNNSMAVSLQSAPHLPDANTVLLDAFDGTTIGEEHGTVSYVPSLPGLGQAVDLDLGDWIKYVVPSWNNQYGTIEAWIYPDTYNYSIAMLQWYNTNISPPAGYIGQFTMYPDGHLWWKSWGPPWPSGPNPTSSSIIPLQEWTHVAVTWSPAGTHLYVNGVVEFSTTEIWMPALNPTTYVYLNGWGLHDHGLMDEFRISSIARSEEEIRAYVVEILNSPPISDPNGPYLGAVGTEIGFDGSASSDPDDVLSYDWDWGDTTSSYDAGTSPTHAYDTAGIYDVCLNVTDAYGELDTACTLAVVYDPEGGFVTGGGWIWSPEGAYTADPSLTGKATFGFVSKYKKGANVPTGNTEFQFKVADLNFKSTSYDWLVIAGSKAKFKGTGTINGAGEYKFMLSAIDDSPDKFRIKIWDAETGAVIYDNMLDADDTADPTTEIQGGSIVIHKPK